jgi:uncharacterized membrane protein YbhN (UPF0104 family)
VKQRFATSLGPLLGLALLTLAFAILHRELQTHHWNDVVGLLRENPPERSMLAILLTILGYWTLTGYDALALRYIHDPLPYRRIALASFVAYVFSHNVGLSFFGGSAVRYRMLSSWGVRADAIGRVIAFALLTFWMGFFFLGSLVHLVWPMSRTCPASTGPRRGCSPPACSTSCFRPRRSCTSPRSSAPICWPW